jgi:hypothetical protein
MTIITGSGDSDEGVEGARETELAYRAAQDIATDTGQ